MTAVIIPTVGSPTLGDSLHAVEQLDPRANQVIVVSSGDATVQRGRGHEVISRRQRLGFAAAVNLGLASVHPDQTMVAVLNDDARPSPGWLGELEGHLSDDDVGAVQGTVTDPSGAIDGRGITFDPWGLPVQVDRGLPADPEPSEARPIVAVSATAALYRRQALTTVALHGGIIFDPLFGSYHEDVDLGLRLLRAGYRARWAPRARCCHDGSSSGRSLTWRHPWWLLANRWRALAGNLSFTALLRILPRLLRGEARAVATLARSNPRTFPVATAVFGSLPLIVARAWLRSSAGPRLSSLPVAS